MDRILSPSPQPSPPAGESGHALPPAQAASGALPPARAPGGAPPHAQVPGGERDADRRTTHREACRVLARLLAYPDDDVRALLPALADWLARDALLSPPVRGALAALVQGLLAGDPLDAQAAYTDCFDRGRRTSLHLFEHVHGDSRDRGPALVSLAQTYADAGLVLAPGELPDYLPAVLEFASTQPPAVAREFLAEMAHILNALHAALARRASPYAAVVAAVLELAGEPLADVPVDDELPLDEAWAEPPAFGGCPAEGRQGAGRPQPIHFVRSPREAA